MQKTPHCQIWGYDFSVICFGPQLRKAEAKGRAHFVQAGIAGTTNITASPPFLSVQDIMAVNGHDHIDILKTDIEGFEFEALMSVIEHFTERGRKVPISQILVELHLFSIEDAAVTPYHFKDIDRFLAWWQILERAGFRPIWTEPNLLLTTKVWRKLSLIGLGKT